MAIFAGTTTSLVVPASYLVRLQGVLAKELYARDYYKKAVAGTGIRRFQNLARAEQNHANGIAAAIVYLGGKPVLKHNSKIKVPANWTAADAECQAIEKTVIVLYKGLIKDCPDPELLPLFKKIQASNHRHLRAVGG